MRKAFLLFVVFISLVGCASTKVRKERDAYQSEVLVLKEKNKTLIDGIRELNKNYKKLQELFKNGTTAELKNK
jgi:predicted  nucleic acid-binding Zn-ribbon protein